MTQFDCTLTGVCEMLRTMSERNEKRLIRTRKNMKDITLDNHRYGLFYEGLISNTDDDCPYDVEAYCRRICELITCSEEVLIVALILLERFLLTGEIISLTFSNLRRLLLVSILISAKFYCDVAYPISQFSKISGISTCLIAKMERKFLSKIDFNLRVKNNQYAVYSQVVLKLGENQLVNCIPKTISRSKSFNDQKPASMPCQQQRRHSISMVDGSICVS
eukprot:TRINITY_DN4999_c0_g2_i1.p1 TRINITY_DN4999_c0_g2~~TRINITY_DN4999_c0_g2_i1.p1  ORF type:complete len:220 (-),score=20.79 TRINITY_DN4999_c0_g2_i1:61-720(-)